MAINNTYRCGECGKESDYQSDAVPDCHGKTMAWLPTGFVTFEWGGPRTYLHLRDEPFASQSDLKSWAKKKGLSLGESSEKVGGARNEMYAGIGKTYSYIGASCRDNPLAGLPGRND